MRQDIDRHLIDMSAGSELILSLGIGVFSAHLFREEPKSIFVHINSSGFLFDFGSFSQSTLRGRMEVLLNLR